MGLFLSTYVNKIDKKGRVSVPAPFRNMLAQESYQGIIAYHSFVNNCIEACGFSRMERLSESIDALDPYSDERDAFAATILGGSVPLPFDGEGRIMLPAELQKQVAINEHVTFVGKGTIFEMWNPEQFKEHAVKAKEIANEKRALLHLKPKQQPNI